MGADEPGRGRLQLFDFNEDPSEMENLIDREPEILQLLRSRAVADCSRSPDVSTMVENGRLKGVLFTARPLGRLHQFAFSRNITSFTVPSEAAFISEALPNTTE